MTLWSYFKEGYFEFFLLSTGLFLISLQPLIIFTILNILPMTKYPIYFATFLFHLAISFVIFGLTFIWWALTRLSGMIIPPYQATLLLTLYFSLGFFFKSAYIVSKGHSYGIVFDPSWIHALVGVPIVLLFLEIYRVSRPKNPSNAYQTKIASLGWVIVSLAVLVSIIERLLSSTSVYYQIFGAMGFTLVVYSLLLDPFALVPRVVGGQYLVICTQRGGLYIYFQQFVKDPSFNTGLFSSAMKGIFDTLSELTGREDIPEVIGYHDLKIVTVTSKSLIAYFICKQPISPVKLALKRLLDKFEDSVRDQGFFEVVLDSKIDVEVLSKLRFAL